MIEKLLWVVVSLPLIHIVASYLTTLIVKKERSLEEKLKREVARNFLETGGKELDEELIVKLIQNRQTSIDKTKLLVNFRGYLLISYVWISCAILVYVLFYNYFN